MSEENKALTRRSWEIVATGSLETLDDALQEVYAHTIVMHEPDEDVRGIEGMRRAEVLYLRTPTRACC